MYLSKAANRIQLTSASFNASGRAYPDLAALGHKTPLYVSGEFVMVDGTSMAAPVVAAVIVHLNAIRLAAGQPVLGWFNPLLYQLAGQWPGIVNDVTYGSNVCAKSSCPPQCTWGFNAAVGEHIARSKLHAMHHITHDTASLQVGTR